MTGDYDAPLDLRSWAPPASLGEIERDAWRFAAKVVGAVRTGQEFAFVQLVSHLGHAHRALLVKEHEHTYRFAHQALDVLDRLGRKRASSRLMQFIFFR